MKWNPKTSSHIRGIVQTSEQGTTRTFPYYYIKKAGGFYLGYTAGRYTFGREIDYRETFNTLKEAREFCETVDRETLILEEVSN
jgi:hypothetical protein